MTTTVVNIKFEEYDEYIGRPSVLGNPFIIGRDGTRDEVIDKFRRYFYNSEHLKEYARNNCINKRLGCYCKPLNCHGYIIVTYLEGL